MHLVAHLQQFFHLGPLALPQQHLFKLFVEMQLVRELQQVGHGVGPRGEHKDEGRHRRAVLVAGVQVEGGGLDEALAQGSGHEVLQNVERVRVGG
jgi:hypothetical protein